MGHIRQDMCYRTHATGHTEDTLDRTQATAYPEQAGGHSLQETTTRTHPKEHMRQDTRDRTHVTVRTVQDTRCRTHATGYAAEHMLQDPQDRTKETRQT